MDEIQEKKIDIRLKVDEVLSRFPTGEIRKKARALQGRLFDFANFLEAKIVMLYLSSQYPVDAREIIQNTLDLNKIVVLPVFGPELKMFKIDNLSTDTKPTACGMFLPVENRCKQVPIDRVDIAIIPSLALDEKGGRIGAGDGFYDRLIPKLPATTRKVAIALEEQIMPHIQMDSHDKHVDIIITDTRIIYKI
jgi:5-formyltetrahydrofolate cyclo-ligase